MRVKLSSPKPTSRRRGYTRLSSKRQVTLPIRVVEELGIAEGDQFLVAAEGSKVVLTPVQPPIHEREAAIRAAAGSLTGVYGRGYLRKLRAEWR